MGAIIEAVQTTEHPETATHNGVVCIFCGLPTPVQTSGEGTSATHSPRPNRRVSIVRCETCGKEAPYPAHEITEFGEVFREPSASLWFAKEAA
jgi:hypothetical protein